MQHEPNTTRQWKAPDALTDGEIALLEMLCLHKCPVSSAAAILGLSPRTIENRSRTIRQKLGMRTLDEALAKWRENAATTEIA
jgi:DNA-binding CsgD family transcriptional regulator